MTDEATDFLRKARASVLAAQHLLDAKDDPGFVISRAYYAMYYCATAVLLESGVSHGKHSALISSFGRDYANSGRMPRHLHRYIIDAFAQRSTGDYEPNTGLTDAQAEISITHANEFIAETEKFLNQQP